MLCSMLDLPCLTFENNSHCESCGEDQICELTRNSTAWEVVVGSRGGGGEHPFRYLQSCLQGRDSQGYREKCFGLTQGVSSYQNLFNWIVHNILGRLVTWTGKLPWSPSPGESMGMFGF